MGKVVPKSLAAAKPAITVGLALHGIYDGADEGLSISPRPSWIALFTPLTRVCHLRSMWEHTTSMPDLQALCEITRGLTLRVKLQAASCLLSLGCLDPGSGRNIPAI